MTTIIAAIAEDNGIGFGGDLLWHIPEDLRHFKRLTMGAPVVMGRKTWESLPKRPLPGRLNIVVSRQEGYGAPGAEVAKTLGEALARAEAAASCDTSEKKDVFVIGGRQLYESALPLADAMELTRILALPEKCDTWFPEWNPAEWILEEDRRPETPTVPEIRFQRYRRITD